ncbi:putative dachshund [Cocos nucifera]|uniref:Putative dachshund n=1 Tax=Cocos nucifera TaxID=13894 RepID=A0A8K0IW81_COCNU|nr:putative dachshund [Cocos nucifera]
MLMATEVSSLARILSAYKEEKGEGKGERERNLVPCDFVGGCGGGAVGVDIDYQVPPSGSEKRLDSPFGRIHLQKSGPAPANRELQDLNLPPASDVAEAGGVAPPPEDSATTDLNLVASAASEYHSVCTLEKVRHALERAERESRGKPHQRRMHRSPSSSSSSSASSTSSLKRREGEEELDGSDSSSGSLMAARCPRCLLYVLVANRDPRCPGCRSHVPVSAIYRKKPRASFSSPSDQL